MKRFFVIALAMMVLGLVAWMLAGKTPKAPLTARVLYRTNTVLGARSYVVVLTNLSGRNVVISSPVANVPYTARFTLLPEGRVPGFAYCLPAHSEVRFAALPDAPDGRQTVIDYHAFSIWEDWRWRSARWPWLAARLRIGNKAINPDQKLVIDLPAD